MSKIEILAPAGSFDSVVAAVRNGADAVYLGEKDFSARSSAKNFDNEELKKAIEYCHIHSVKVHIAINTIVFDDELEKVKEAIITAAKCDADAIIVQNIGVAMLAKKIAPKLELHASTQLSVHTPSGVKALYEMGFSRVVLSREMSKEEIKEITKIPIETEVFVHGALCMCVSGQCYFSAMLGSRSGNRGACAQPCRLPFSVGSQKNGHALSLKDNSLICHIAQLESMGITSAKIEGRMKRPEYVAAAVRACKEQRDNGFVSIKTNDLLRDVFSRTGFTDGYFTANRGYGMFGTRTKNDVVSADESLFSEIRQTYKDEVQNIYIDASFIAKIGEKPTLKVTDGKNEVVVVGDSVCERAIKVPLYEEKCKSHLLKTGSTAYNIQKLDIKLDSDISIPISSINKLRRNALLQLDDKRKCVHNYEINDVKLPLIIPYKAHYKSTRIRLTSPETDDSLSSYELVFVPLFSSIQKISEMKSKNINVGVEIPRGMFGRENEIKTKLDTVKEIGITDVLCNNIGAIYIAKEKNMTLHSGFGMNFVNTLDLLWAEDYGIKDTELSFELTFEKINRLGGKIKRGFISYGFLPLMLCRNCPNKSNDIDCKTCKNQSEMQDRKGEHFFLKCDGNCTEILNCVPLYIDKKEISTISTDFNILRYSVENYVENVNEIMNNKRFSMSKHKFTRGLYLRGVK